MHFFVGIDFQKLNRLKFPKKGKMRLNIRVESNKIRLVDKKEAIILACDIYLEGDLH